MLCSAACATKFSGHKVVAVRRPEPVESKRPQASYQRARRALSGAFTQVKRLGYTSFAAVASAPGGRTVQQVRVGTTEDGRPDTAGAMLAILAAVFADPQRLVKKLDARKAEREAKALEEGGAAEIVRKVPASVLAAFEVRVYAVLCVSSASPLPSSPHVVASFPHIFPFKRQTAIAERRREEEMVKDLVAVPVPELDAEIMAHDGGADKGILVERDTTGNIKKLKKRFDKIEKGLRGLQAGTEGLFGDRALGEEIEASTASLMARFDKWTTWPQAPLPGGGVGLRAIDAVKKLWLLTKEAGEHYAAFKLRAEEHQRAVDAHMAAAKRPRKGARAVGAPPRRGASQQAAGKRAAAALPRSGARGTKATPLGGIKRNRPENVDSGEEDSEEGEGASVAAAAAALRRRRDSGLKKGAGGKKGARRKRVRCVTGSDFEEAEEELAVK